MRRIAMTLAVITVLAVVPTTQAASKSATTDDFGVQSYQYLYYNVSTCSSVQYYQIYRWEFRFHRQDTARTARYAGDVFAEGVDCARTFRQYVLDGTGRFYNVCWACGSSTSTLWSRTYTYSFSGKPYLNARNISWVGSWLCVQGLDNANHVWAEDASPIALSGAAPFVC